MSRITRLPDIVTLLKEQETWRPQKPQLDTEGFVQTALIRNFIGVVADSHGLRNVLLRRDSIILSSY